MIIRQAMLRHGLNIIPITRKTFVRRLATTLDGIEQSLNNSLKETHSIESLLQDTTSDPIPTIDAFKGPAVAHPNIPETPEEDPYNSHAVSAQWRRYTNFLETTANLGSDVTPHYDPNELIKRPPKPDEVTLELLMASQAHMGHSTSLWNPMNSRYIYGYRHGIHIISLEVTAAHLRRACKIVEGTVENGGLVLFVGTRRGQNQSVIRAAEVSGGYHLFTRWKPGSITNRGHILRHCAIKAVDEFGRDIEGYEREIEDLPAVKPDLVVCLNPLENYVLLRECGQESIPTIGIIDTNADPTWVTYPIPANDDSLRCTNVIAGALGMAGKAGKDKRLAAAKQGQEMQYKTVDLVKMREDDPTSQKIVEDDEARIRRGFVSRHDYLSP